MATNSQPTPGRPDCKRLVGCAVVLVVLAVLVLLAAYGLGPTGRTHRGRIEHYSM